MHPQITEGGASSKSKSKGKSKNNNKTSEIKSKESRNNQIMAVGTGVAESMSKVRRSIRDGLAGLITQDGDIDKGYLLRKILRVLLGSAILWLAHKGGSWANRTIDERIRDANERWERRVRERGGESVAASESSLKSRNSIAKLGGRIAYVLAFGIGFLFVLRVLGVEVASIVALISTIGFAVGFAIQGTLGDVAAGILLALFQTYEVGDVIKLDDYEGKVIDFQTVNTLLQHIDTLTLLTVPNRVIQDSVIVNYSRSHYHAYEVFVTISNRQPDEEMTVTRIIGILLQDLADADKYPPSVLRREGLAPVVGVHSMDQPGTKLVVKVFMTHDNISASRMQVRTRIRQALDKHGVMLIDKD